MFQRDLIVIRPKSMHNATNIQIKTKIHRKF